MSAATRRLLGKISPCTRENEDLLRVGQLTFSKLVRGTTLSGKALNSAINGFANSLLKYPFDIAPDSLELNHAIHALCVRPGSSSLRQVASALREVVCNNSACRTVLCDAALKAEYLAGASGCPTAALGVATAALALAEEPATPPGEAHELAAAATEWLAVSFKAQPFEDPWNVRRSTTTPSAKGARERAARTRAEMPPPSFYEPDAEATEWPEDQTTCMATSGVVVMSAIGNAGSTEGKRVEASYSTILGARLPLIEMPDLALVRHSLLAAYPHASSVIDAVLRELVGRDDVRLPPTVFVGPPGCGKTSFAKDLLRALQVPHALYSCGSSADNSLGGTPRRYQTGEPSLPVSLVTAHRTASPGIILDELEKAAGGVQNGNAHDALLGLLEPQSSAAWLDPYVQAPVDLSRVVWLATANSMAGVPGPLRDRCRVLAFPAPGTEHLAGLATSILRRSMQARGLDPRWAEPLDGVELAMVGRAWRGGSLRALARLLEGVLAARDMAPGRH